MTGLQQPAAAVTPTLLDGPRIRRQRQSLGLSERDVAKRLGVTGQVIASLERGLNHSDVTALLVIELAALLALTPSDLLRIRPTPPCTPAVKPAGAAADDDDAVTVGALLAAEDTLVPVLTLAAVLDWEPDRVLAALAILAERLEGTGQRLHRLGHDIKIVPAASRLDPAKLTALTRRSFARRGMSLSQARLLWQVSNGTLASQQHGNAERVSFATLVNADLVTFEAGDARGGRPVLSADAAFSLR